HNYQVADKTNGRIFKITYGDVKPWKGDLAKLSDLELAKLQTSKNEWMVRHARRLLQERAEERKILADAVSHLEGLWEKEYREYHRLRVLWALNATKQLSNKKLVGAFDIYNE